MEDELNKEMNEQNRCKYFVLDISDRSQYPEIISYINSKAKIDVLVQNAGITRDGVFKRLNYKKWQQVLRC